jgi:hypothetical protein
MCIKCVVCRRRCDEKKDDPVEAAVPVAATTIAPESPRRYWWYCKNHADTGIWKVWSRCRGGKLFDVTPEIVWHWWHLLDSSTGRCDHDLCQCCNLIHASQEDAWEMHDSILECKERLQVGGDEIDFGSGWSKLLVKRMTGCPWQVYSVYSQLLDVESDLDVIPRTRFIAIVLQLSKWIAYRRKDHRDWYAGLSR